MPWWIRRIFLAASLAGAVVSIGIAVWALGEGAKTESGDRRAGGKIATAKSLREFIGDLESGDEKRIAEAALSIDESLQRPLGDSLADALVRTKSPETRGLLIEALQKLQTRQSWPLVVKIALDKKEDDLARLPAISAVATLGYGGVALVDTIIADNAEPMHIRSYCLHMASTASYDSFRWRLLEIAENPRMPYELRMTAVGILGGNRESVALPTLLRIAEEPVPEGESAFALGVALMCLGRKEGVPIVLRYGPTGGLAGLRIMEEFFGHLRRPPQELGHRSWQSWYDWWKAHAEKIRWDAGRKVFLLDEPR